MKQTIVLCALLMAVGSAFAAPAADEMTMDCSDGRAEECTKEWLSFWKTEIPSTEEEIMGKCDLVRNGSKCARKYIKDCANPSTREMAKMMVTGMNKVVTKHCSGEGPKNLIKYRSCAVQARSPVQMCYKQIVRDLYTIKGADKKNWHSLSCCYASRASDCGQLAMTKNCNEESATYFKSEAVSLVSELTETFCSEKLVWGTKACADIALDLPEPVLPKDKTVSAFPIMLEIMKELTVTTEA